KLSSHDLLKCAGREGADLVPGRSLDQIGLYEVVEALRHDDDRVYRPQGGIEPELQKRITSLTSCRKSLLQQRTLADLVREGWEPADACPSAGRRTQG